MNCYSLKRINFPSTLTAIGAAAFAHCVSLKEVKLVGGILEIELNVFHLCRSLKRIAIPSKAFVIGNGAISCRLLTSGTITPTRVANYAPTYHRQLVIASKCFESMSMTDLAEVETAIDVIINNLDQSVRTTRAILERIRALFAHYELVEATTILELAIWKAKMEEFDDLNARATTSTDEYHDQTRSGKRAKVGGLTREEWRVNCGAEVVIQNMLSFL